MLGFVFEWIILYEILSGNVVMLVLIAAFPFVYIGAQILDEWFDRWITNHPARIPDQTERKRVHEQKVQRAIERTRRERIAKVLRWDPTLTVEDARRVSDRYESLGPMPDRLTKRYAREILESIRADDAANPLRDPARIGRVTGR